VPLRPGRAAGELVVSTLRAAAGSGALCPRGWFVRRHPHQCSTSNEVLASFPITTPGGSEIDRPAARRGQPFSVTVVSGWRRLVSGLTKCPVIADGQYTSHAGPAYVFGKGHCVNWGGHIDNRHVQIYNTNCAGERRVTFTR
jgi:hypothetical protein